MVREWGERDYMVALLHDVFEDTGLPHEVVRELFGQDVYDDVLLLTRDADECSYSAYIERIADEGSNTALRVKLGDLADNLDGPDESWHRDLHLRYERAQARLTREWSARVALDWAAVR